MWRSLLTRLLQHRQTGFLLKKNKEPHFVCHTSERIWLTPRLPKRYVIRFVALIGWL